ncbi:MAG: monovalent cation/H+ antiporter subunit D family protein [Alphaproteobacteria bacterium]|nr:monovalent cation/H+ antiporter subunit D family protein [Alphaproteobacteria bacterium]
MSVTLLLSLALTIPLAGAVLIAMSDRKPNQRETVTLVTAVALFSVVVALTTRVLAGERPYLELLDILPGIAMAFRIEPLGMMFALIASFLWIVNSIYSIGYMRGNKERHQTRFYTCFAVALWATMGVAFSANLLSLFIFYEVLTISTYPLVTHHGNENAVRGGRTYLGILLTTSIGVMLPAIILTAYLVGTLDFKAGGIMAGKVSDQMGGLLLFLFMYGTGKAALMPIHRWLPAAMVAPTPVSALLHAVAVVKAGVFIVVKLIVYTFGIGYLSKLTNADWLLYVAGATILIASVIALRADNLKRRLAYSTVSQLSYVIMAAAILVPISAMGAAIHIAAHAFGKITLFFAAGSIYTAAHKTEVSQLDGIGRRMPWTMGAFAIGALSMIGVPPTAGFISKWYILLGALDAKATAAIVVIVLSTILNAAYFLPVVYAAFFKKPPEGDAHNHGEAPLAIVIALAITAGGTIVLFFLPDVPIALARSMAGLGG